MTARPGVSGFEDGRGVEGCSTHKRIMRLRIDQNLPNRKVPASPEKERW